MGIISIIALLLTAVFIHWGGGKVIILEAPQESFVLEFLKDGDVGGEVKFAYNGDDSIFYESFDFLKFKELGNPVKFPEEWVIRLKVKNPVEGRRYIARIGRPVMWEGISVPAIKDEVLTIGIFPLGEKGKVYNFMVIVRFFERESFAVGAMGEKGFVFDINDIFSYYQRDIGFYIE